MGQVVYIGLCLLGCLLLNPLVEGSQNDTVEARARCPEGTFYHKHFCYQFVNQYLSWYDAEIECQMLKSWPEVHLASVRSQTEGRIILLYLKRKGVSSAWMGLQGAYSNGRNDWVWSDESPFISPLWDGSSLSSSSNECVSLYNIQNSNTKKIYQRSCLDTLPFVCKYKADY